MAEIDLQEKIDGFLHSAMKKYIVRDYDSALRDLKAAEMLDKNNPEILYNIGINYSRMGLDKSAIEYFQKVIKLKQTFIDSLVIKKLLAYSRIRIKDYKESLRFINEVLELVPLDTIALNMKGYCFEAQGKYKEALHVYTMIIEHEKENFNAYNSIAYILSKSGGDLEQSLKCARIAYASDTTNPAYLDTLGFVHLKMGHVDQAWQYLTQALQKAPLSEEIRDHMNECKNLKNLQP